MAFRQAVSALSELLADTITGATIIGGTITGALIRTAASGMRWELLSGVYSNEIRGYTGSPNEADTQEGGITIAAFGPQGTIRLESPSMWNDAHSQSTGKAYFSLNARGELDPPTNEAIISAKTVGITSESGGAGMALVAEDGPITLDGFSGVDIASALDVAGLATLGAGLGVTGDAAISGTLAPGTIDFTGDSITKLRYGIETVTVPGGSQFADLAIPHGLGNAPSVAIVCAVNVSTYYANVVSLTPTNVNVRAIQRDGGTGGANVKVAYLAIWA